MNTEYYKKYEPLFGSWRIVREIGAGSFGRVFEIEREDFGHKYRAALKVITIPQNRSDVDNAMLDGMDEGNISNYYQSFVSELINEVSIMSEFKGESNIVSYEDHMVIPHADGKGWDILIRMELLTPLLKYAQTHTLDRADIIKLGIDICRALELCSRRSIVHRDIKPENIFVSDSGNFKLGDFGIARAVEKDDSGLSKKGTYTYMAPEVYKGRAYDATVDIYSLGVVLYRFLNANRAPFMPSAPTPISFGDREQAVSRRMNGETLPKPLNADDALADIILKACAYNACDRYASAAEMRKELEAISCDADAERFFSDGTVILTYGRTESDDEEKTFALNKEFITQREERLQSTVQEQAPHIVEKSTAERALPQISFTESKRKAAPSAGKVVAVLLIVAAFAAVFFGFVISNDIYFIIGEGYGWSLTGTSYYEGGEKAVGWREFNGDTYYFGEDGELLTGKQEIDGKYYYFFKNNQFMFDSLRTRYGNGYGAMATGWWDLSDGQTYFSENGEFVGRIDNLYYPADIEATHSEEKAYFYTDSGNTWLSDYMVLKEPIKGFNILSIYVDVGAQENYSNAQWKAYARTPDGKWRTLGRFDVVDGDGRISIVYAADDVTEQLAIDMVSDVYTRIDFNEFDAFKFIPNSIDEGDTFAYNEYIISAEYVDLSTEAFKS